MSFLTSMHADAAKDFEGSGKPRLVYGLGIHNNLKGLDLKTVASKAGSVKVDIRTEKSNCTVGDISEEVRDKVFTLIKRDNAFLHLHASKTENGAMILVPKDTQNRIQVKLHLEGEAAHSHSIIVVEDGANVHIEEMVTAEKSVEYASHIVEIFVGNNATVKYTTVQNTPEKTFFFTHKQSKIEEGGRLDWNEGSFGSSQTKSEILSDMAGKNAHTEFRSVYFTTEDQVIDNNTVLFHSSPRTTSNMVVHGALDGKSKAIYRGNVKMAHEAKHCDGRQHEETLLLSNSAEADIVPNLEIDNHEVSCAHSAAISSLNQNSLFYMQSRGIPWEDAKSLLIESFFEPFVASMDCEDFQKDVRSLVRSKI